VYRIQHRGAYNLTQWEVKGVWTDLFLVRNEPAYVIDLEMSNFWSCAHPTVIAAVHVCACLENLPECIRTGAQARFVTSFFVSRVIGEDRHHILNGAYVVRRRDGTSVSTPIADEAQLRELLDRVFDIAVPADARGLGRYL
jgi:arylamine N-acetyltransferase